MSMSSKIKKSLVVGLLLIGAAGIVYYVYQARHAVPTQGFSIVPYNAARDRTFFFDEFKAHWSLLVMSSEYDIDFMLTQKAPNKREPLYYGKMDITMLCDGNKSIGFITYYMRTPYQGEILFLDITKEYQGQHLGEKLLEYAFADLKIRGATMVNLFTRSTNFPAQK
jgi:ribosomal protein S18 acetylase RimI-like enzyme